MMAVQWDDVEVVSSQDIHRATRKNKCARLLKNIYVRNL